MSTENGTLCLRREICRSLVLPDGFFRILTESGMTGSPGQPAFADAPCYVLFIVVGAIAAVPKLSRRRKSRTRAAARNAHVACRFSWPRANSNQGFLGGLRDNEVVAVECHRLQRPNARLRADHLQDLARFQTRWEVRTAKVFQHG